MKWLWVVILSLVFIWSAIGPADRLTWALEVSPVVIGAVLMLATYQRFPLTGLLYFLILVHCIVLLVGGHYTYAEVPLFDAIAEHFGSERNNYDKVGHFFQGLVRRFWPGKFCCETVWSMVTAG